MSADAINLAAAELTVDDGNDVRNWPITIPLDALTINPAGDRVTTVHLDFAAKMNRAALPEVTNMEQGQITHTLWMGCNIGGVWRIAAIVQCINDYVPTGPLLEPGQVPTNLVYYCRPPMKTYQPQPGEPVVFFITTGVTRRYTTQPPSPFQPGRSQVIMARFAGGRYEGGAVEQPTQPQQPAQPAQPATTDPTIVQLLHDIQATQSALVIAGAELGSKVDQLLTRPQQAQAAAGVVFPIYTGTLFGYKITLTPTKG